MPHLEAADSVLDLARRLGAICLDREAELAEISGQRRSGEELERLEVWAGAASFEVWEEVVTKPHLLEQTLGIELVRILERTRLRYPLDCLGVLRGLCRRPLPEFFEVTRDQIGLDRGLPVPFATRPLPSVLGAGCTTSVETLANTGLLAPLPFDIYRSSAEDKVRVVLDFSHRDRIDELGWSTEAGLPKIASVHPLGGSDYTVTRNGDRFFGVRPANWDPDAISRLLAEAKSMGAELAVLPELSLPAPDALAKKIADERDRFPALIVAGSAHVSEGGATDSVRANESRIYLDGRYVAVARKHHGYKTKELGDETFEAPLSEDLSAEQKTIMVLSGSQSRLAVVICADLQDAEIPHLLKEAGVNLLLVPAMSRRIGSFVASVSQISGFCQGVAMVANTRWSDDGRPFLCLCAVPREEPDEQAGKFTGSDEGSAPLLVVLDPNLPLPDGVSQPSTS